MTDKITEAQMVIEWIKETLDGAYNVEPSKLHDIFQQTLAAVYNATRVECWLLVKDGQPLDHPFGGISDIDGWDGGLFQDIYEQEIWVSMHDCVLENTFAPGIVRATFIVSNFVHQEGQISIPEAGWDFLPHWENEIELISSQCIGESVRRRETPRPDTEPVVAF